jgi:PhnB protein
MQAIDGTLMNSESSSTKVPATAIAPLLSVRRGKDAIAFYQQAFGAKVLFHVEDDKGEVVAQLSVDGAEFWLADESPAHLNFSPETLKGCTSRIVLTVADPAAVFAQAIVAGATSITPVSEQYGWLIGRLVDPFGHHWEIGKPLGKHP